MKRHASILPFALCIAVGLVPTTTNAATCNLSDLSVFASDPNLVLCQTEAHVSILELTGTPNDEQLAALCSTKACVELVRAVLKLNPEDCTVPTPSALLLMSELVEPVAKYCAAEGIDVTVSSSSSASSESSGADVDVGTVTASSATSEDVDADAGSPSSSSTELTPTPTPDSGALSSRFAMNIGFMIVASASVMSLLM